MSTQQFMKKYFGEILAIIWAIAFLTLTLLKVSLPLLMINRIAYTVVCFLVTTQILRATLQSNNNDILLSGAMGMSCLALSGLYFLLTVLTSTVQTTLSVGDFSSTCSFLFFIVILIKLKDNSSVRYSKLLNFINFLTILIILFSIYSIVSGTEWIANACEACLDLICISLSVSLLRVKPYRFFVVIMLILGGCDLISVTLMTLKSASNTVLFQSVFLIITSTSVLMYFLLARATLSLKTQDDQVILQEKEEI
jgi:hypothetical protein